MIVGGKEIAYQWRYSTSSDCDLNKPILTMYADNQVSFKKYGRDQSVDSDSGIHGSWKFVIPEKDTDEGYYVVSFNWQGDVLKLKTRTFDRIPDTWSYQMVSQYGNWSSSVTLTPMEHWRQ